MKFLVIAPAAWSDLKDIADYIARDNPERAQTFVEELIDVMQTVGERPLSFPERSEWRKGLRSALHHSYHVVFRIDGSTVEILRVLHGARDIDSLF